MFFFGTNLNSKHKVTLCLAILGILGNLGCIREPYTFYVTFLLPNGYFDVNAAQFMLLFGIFVNTLVLAVFRKF